MCARTKLDRGNCFLISAVEEFSIADAADRLCGLLGLYTYHSLVLNNSLDKGKEGSYGRTHSSIASFSEASYVGEACR